MLMGDQLNNRQQHRRIFNIFCIGQDRAGKGLRLRAAALMAHVEGFFQLWVVAEHAVIEIAGQCH